MKKVLVVPTFPKNLWSGGEGGEPVSISWSKMKEVAKKYKFAEQDGFNGRFKNWQNSQYFYPWQDPGNNSNVFARHVIDRVLEWDGIFHELPGFHPPGLVHPVEVPRNRRWVGVPFR